MKYRIYDTFMSRPVSGHRSIRTAVLAEDKFSRSSPGYSYNPSRIELWDAEESEWVKVPTADVRYAQQQYVHGW